MKKFMSISALLFLTVIITLFVMVTNPAGKHDATLSGYEVDPHILRHHVEKLASVSPPRSHAHVQSLNETAAYVADEFQKYTDRVELQNFPVWGDTFGNVSAMFGPSAGGRIVIGAHYDVCGDQPGADDNASGVAGLLEIARLLSLSSPSRPVELVAYTLEEPPHFRTEHMGSAHHAKKLRDENIDVLFMISLECIGFYSDDDHSQSYPVGLLKWFYPSKANFIAVVGNIKGWSLVREFKSKMRAASEIPVESINAPAFIPGVDFSDHLNYWKNGYDALMVTNTAFFRNERYHEVTDTPETLDYRRMAEVVRAVFATVRSF